MFLFRKNKFVVVALSAAVFILFASMFLFFKVNNDRANEAHSLAQKVSLNERETRKLAQTIITIGAARREETCGAFYKLYKGKREDLISQFKQIDTPLTREFFTISPEQTEKVRQTYLPRYRRWANKEIPTYCPQKRLKTIEFPQKP